MKVGDLVTMEKGLTGKIVFSGIGVVVDVRRRKYDRQRSRVAVFWCDGGGTVDWEPLSWLEVISESR